MNIRKLTILLSFLAATVPAISRAQTPPASSATESRPTVAPTAETATESVMTEATATVATDPQTDLQVEPPVYPVIDYDNPKSYTINKIEVKGVQYLLPELLIATSGLKEGDVIQIPGSAISRAISKLWDQRYFSDVNIVMQTFGDSVNLEIYLQERPRIYRWAFEGVNKSKAKTLEEEMKLRRGTELSDYVLDKNIQLIKKHFAEKGFRNTEVTTRIDNNAQMKNGVDVTFIIDRNARVKIGEIVFSGNDNFTDKRLRRTMKKTNQVGINFFKSFKLNETDYEADKENIIDFYNSQGFRNAAIVSDSIYTLNEKRIGIEIDLDEGHKYYIRNVKWTGNTVYPTEFLQNIFGVKKGDTYDKKLIDKRLGIGKEEDFEDPTQIKSMYQNQGYLFSMIEPSEVVVERDSIDLDIKIFEGRPFTINKVEITGNYKINDEVVRRDIYTRPGELYNRSLILRTLRELAQTQRFDPANTIPVPTPVSSDLVDVAWQIAESPSDKFDISAGMGQNQFIASVGIQLTNLDIQSLFKKGVWRPYPSGKGQQLMARFQTNGTWYTAGSLSFTEPWLGGKKPNSLTVSVYHSKQTDSRNWWGTITDVTQYLKSTGVSAGLGRRLSLPDPYFTLYNEIGYQRYDLMNYSYYFPIKDGKSNVFTFKTVFGRNTLNNYIYPSSGTEFSLSLALTPPYSLFDGVDYKAIDKYNNDYDLGRGGTEKQYEANNAKRYKWVEYHKWMAKMAWYYPLSRDQKLVFMAKAELGYLGHYNKYKISPFEGFSVGGDGMTGGYYVPGVDLIALRGYDDGALTPTYSANGFNVDNASVYNKYTFELRYPVLTQPGYQVWVLAFAEGGNGFMDWKDFNPFSVKRSAGIGARIYMPVLGLVGIDWAYGFDAQYGATGPRGSKLHFTMGMQF